MQNISCEKETNYCQDLCQAILTEHDLDLDQVHLSKVRTPKGTERIGDSMGKSEIQFSQTSVSIPSVPFGV